MLNDKPSRIAVWTDAGRNDSAAEVAVTPVIGGWRVDIAAPQAAVAYVALRWDRPVSGAMRVLGDHWERGYGDLEWRGIVHERVLPWYFLLHDTVSGSTTGVGVATGASSFASWRVDEQGITLVLDMRNGGLGVHLGDRRLHAATVYSLGSAAGETPFAFARRFCSTLCPSPRLPKAPVYGANDWYHRYGNISDQTVRTDAALVRELSPDGDNLPFSVIDAGWFEGRGCNGGPYDRGNESFPDMQALAHAVRAMDVRPGIWIRPLLTTEQVPASWRFSPDHPLAREQGSYLDPSVPEVIARVRDDIARLAGWGYELIKHDFTTYDITGTWGFLMGGEVTRKGWAFADRSRTTAEIVRDLYVAIREAAGDAYLIGCNTVGHIGAGLFELQRTGDDTSGHDWERTRKMGVNTLAFRMQQHDAFFAVDADCVGLTRDVPWELNRQWLDLLGRSGTPLFVSADPAALGVEQREALKLAYARAAKPAAPGEPLDWMQTTCPRVWRFGDETVTYNWADYAGSAFPCP